MEQTTKLAIVTGAASGLGRAFCVHLARAGDWYVVVADIDETEGRRTLSAMSADAPGAQGEFAQLDVCDRDAWRRLGERLRSQWPDLHLLVNNAGVCASGEVGAGDAELWRRVIDVNFFGPLWGCHALVDWLKESARRKPQPMLINVASIAGVLTAPAMGAYGTAKAALIALSETLYCELQGSGVQVRVAIPGFFATKLLEKGHFADDRHLELAQSLSNASRFSAEDVVAASLSSSAGLYVVVGRRSRALMTWKRLAPLSLLRTMARRYRRLMDAAHVVH